MQEDSGQGGVSNVFLLPQQSYFLHELNKINGCGFVCLFFTNWGDISLHHFHL